MKELLIENRDKAIRQLQAEKLALRLALQRLADELEAEQDYRVRFERALEQARAALDLANGKVSMAHS